MPRNQFRPLGANKPGTVLLLAHGTSRSLRCLHYAAMGHWCDRNEAFVVLRIVDLHCWRVERDKTKRSTQSRVAAMAERHRQMTVVEIGAAAAEIAGLSA